MRVMLLNNIRVKLPRPLVVGSLRRKRRKRVIRLFRIKRRKSVLVLRIRTRSKPRSNRPRKKCWLSWKTKRDCRSSLMTRTRTTN